MNIVNANELQGMIQHWLRTPPNGYLGSRYGSDPLSMLQQAMLTLSADAFEAKMREDIPLLGALPRNAVNLYFQDRGNDSKKLFIEILGSVVTIDNTGQVQ